ncbi:MAG: DNA repair protein RecN [Christensenellales bacterium]|jgi:DNA repair protein RecN (Recombination protein N)
MLLELTIHHIALIESLKLEFERGFTVLTGETGAGKSIVVDSLNLVLGGRADRALIRTGADRARVEAVFDISENPRARAIVGELGLEPEEGIAAVSRELSRSGRNICRVSGMVVPLATLRQLTSTLVDIHGQHEHQALINPQKHVEFLDSFGDAQHRALLSDVARVHAERSRVTSEVRRVTSEAAERARTIDMLTFQIEEISALRPKRGEEEKLEKRARFYENAERIRTSVEEAYRLTYGGDSRAPGAQEQLDLAARALDAVAKHDDRIEQLANRIKEAYYAAQDAGMELQSLLDSLDYDPALADKVADRLDKIRRLERKYGSTLDEVIDFGEHAANRLETLKRSEEMTEELKKRRNALDQELAAACAKLTTSRDALSARLSEAVKRQLEDLGMAKTRFEVRLTPAKPTATGAEEVEFMISANPGEPLKPLASVASGGELSRIMLALKAISTEAEGVDAMVFDEIDTGVSGRMAQVVGEKMRAIARKRQVICVTHLPQIAALGDWHYLVEKHTDGARTDSAVRRLDDAGRVLEISRLIGGGADSQTSILHARHLLSHRDEVRT